MSKPEEWRACVGWPEYEVSSEGRVRRVKAGQGARAGWVRSLIMGPQGYWMVCLGGAAGKDVKVLVHRLVVEAFIGPLANGLEANHKNGIKSDNRLENLKRVTHKQNCQHGYDTGLNNRRNHRGERCGAVKLTEDYVRTIRRRLAEGEKATVLAKEFGVGLRTVYGVKLRETWGWLE